MSVPSRRAIMADTHMLTRVIAYGCAPLATALKGAAIDPRAVTLLRAIACQESNVQHRWQTGGGPARGYWQFEPIGVQEVLRHPASALAARETLMAFDYPPDYPPVMVHTAITHNDLLAAAFARLAIWRHRDPLPDTEQAGWDQYVAIWRPGAVTGGGKRAEDARARWQGSWAYGELSKGVRRSAD